MTLAHTPPTATITHSRYSYSPAPSIASSASSSQSSGWSVASAVSNTTSVASCTGGASAPGTNIIPSLNIQRQFAGSEQDGWLLRKRVSVSSLRGSDSIQHPHPPSVTVAQEPVPIEQRRNARRTNRLVEGANAGCPVSEGCPLPPVPTLQRQVDRKVNFVDNLVDSAAQIVETIWPPPKMLICATPKDKVLPLRTFIQETLRRSRTSYSTLQVALYYLIVIRPHLPPRDCDISSLPAEEAQMTRAKQCGRRMFLAALILASKYLQDRNYSARAWSKISGLNTQEINVNEMAFLDAVNWRLHISETNFQKWTDLVLKYTSDHNPSSASSARANPWVDEEERKREWCDLVLKLSPDLNEAELLASGGLTPCAVDADIVASTSPLTIEPFVPIAPAQQTPAAPVAAQPVATLAPRATEHLQTSHPHAFKALHQPLPKAPAFRRSSSSQLHSGTVTPAAGICSSRLEVTSASRCSAMASVAKIAENALSGATMEKFPFAPRRGSDALPPPVLPPSQGGCIRRSSLSASVSKPGPSSSPAFPKAKQSCELSKLVFTTFAPPSPSSVASSVKNICTSPRKTGDHRMTPCVSPKSREAALSLNMLKETYSPCSSGSTTPTGLSRKRSYPESAMEGHPGSALRVEANVHGYAADGTTSVTPKFKSLNSGFRSPSLAYGSPTRSPAPDRKGKRLRCAPEKKMGGMNMIEGMSVAQNVR
ncbi:unnamed protein product [Tuber melanosporum]|uniref:(Perigord truffle) hypothetical protein n=1 Tax=Tuber melanosporum (strain Mel28) TaxID=656061 RepID=D5GQ25_TUBMM|nr:uncharacterized protein GSTUM_00012164001 [Tuber melanosporum]CAZ86618.1 unnamed protein product [Tuber melanosporum]